MTDDHEGVANLIKAIKDHGRVQIIFQPRPVKDCFAAAFWCVFGGVTALSTCVLVGGGMEYVFRLVKGWLS